MTYQQILADERDSEVQRLAAAMERNVAHAGQWRDRVGVVVIDASGLARRVLIDIVDACDLIGELTVARDSAVAWIADQQPDTMPCPGIGVTS